MWLLSKTISFCIENGQTAPLYKLLLVPSLPKNRLRTSEKVHMEVAMTDAQSASSSDSEAIQ